MNNLLRTLTESQVRSAHSGPDLKLLLTTVKEGRRQSYDSKLSDPFYDSLEGLLLDLKSVTIDNHDAEAFLKPVLKAEAPDYYDVISNPMDFATMLKKVKSKQYKSKREFKDDLELIWANCYTYNAAENHPLRPAVKRLKLKADRLLKYITDRKERTDPPIPSDMVVTNIARPKLNGNVSLNGRALSHNRSPSYPTPVPKSSTPSLTHSATPPLAKNIPRRNLPFPDTPAISRTPDGMSLFLRLDQGLLQSSNASSSNSNDNPFLLEKLQELAVPIERNEADQEAAESPGNSAMQVDEVAGDKRKTNGFADNRPRKRARYSSQFATPISFEKDELSELWWGAAQSDTLLANGLPGIPYMSSSGSSPPHTLDRKPQAKAKRRKKRPEPPPKSLLTTMNTNIKTMKRLRHTHAKFAALNVNSSNNEDPDGGGEGLGTYGGGGGNTPTVAAGEDDGGGVVDDKVDERPWSVPVRGKRRISGIELGEDNAADCVRWMGGKVLEHAGFQGSSQIALDVLASVTSEYLLNVGRTIRFLCDKYSATMTPEEIILHTLFESGTSKIQDLERYISDDVERYGTRLSELEKKLVSAYRESTAVEHLEDEGLFDEEDEEDAGALAIGDFADALGEDYLGLRALGIAAEFGMSSLSIPKKLLKGKKGQNKMSSIAAKPSEPPPPYPPPPPFIPLSSAKVDDQIGLLKSYYHTRISTLAAASLPPPAPASLPGPSMGYAQPMLKYGMAPYPPVAYPPVAPDVKPLPLATLILPDDAPSAAHVKISPLGQIIKGGPSGGSKKKKLAAVAAGTGPGTDAAAAPKKKKGMIGVGTGNGRKKKLAEEQQFALPVTAAPIQILPPMGQ